MRILLTAFEPFDETGLNSSQEACRVFLERHGGEWDLRFVLLPVRYGDDTAAAREALRGWEPDVVLHTGQASGAREIRVERLAVNVRYPEDTKPFVAGHQPIDPDGPAALFSTLPVDAIAAAITAAGIPSAVSNHAGIYLCNHVLYQSLLREAVTARRVGFLHIPSLPQQADAGFSLTAEEVATALQATFQVLTQDAGHGSFTAL